VRDDQYARLKGLSEKLTDVVLVEANPEKWPGVGKELAELTRDERGDRYWCKKNAAATLTMLMKVHSLTGVLEQRGGFGAPPADPEEPGGDVDLDKEIRSAEKEAARVINRLQHEARSAGRSKKA
jgi:hypothetical protein